MLRQLLTKFISTSPPELGDLGGLERLFSARIRGFKQLRKFLKTEIP
jgi:hypothetical protein